MKSFILSAAKENTKKLENISESDSVVKDHADDLGRDVSCVLCKGCIHQFCFASGFDVSPYQGNCVQLLQVYENTPCLRLWKGNHCFFKLSHWRPPVKLGVLEAVQKVIDIKELNGSRQWSKVIGTWIYLALTPWLLLQSGMTLTFSGMHCILTLQWLFSQPPSDLRTQPCCQAIQLPEK